MRSYFALKQIVKIYVGREENAELYKYNHELALNACS
jgi:hypothetical protein